MQVTSLEATLVKYKDALKRAKERVLELQAEKVSGGRGLLVVHEVWFVCLFCTGASLGG